MCSSSLVQCKSGRSKSTSSSKHDSDSGGLTPGISQEMLDTADADSDTSSLGEYDMVIKQS